MCVCIFESIRAFIERSEVLLLPGNVGLTIRLIVSRQMFCICWKVWFVVYNALVAPARLVGLGLTITRRAVVSLIRRPRYSRWNPSEILVKKATMGL